MHLQAPTTPDPLSCPRRRAAALRALAAGPATTAALADLTGLDRGGLARELRLMEAPGFVTRGRTAAGVVWRVELLGVTALHQLLKKGE